MNTESKKMLRDALCDALCNIASRDSRIAVLDSDLINSSGLGKFMEEFPERTFDCGIQEANMIGVAGGLSMTGWIPFVHSFASFASRRVADQVFLAGIYNKQNIKIIGSDPGIINCPNGGTHMGFEDIGIMRSMPGVTIVDPTDETMLVSILPEIIDTAGVFYIRLFRKTKVKIYNEGTRFSIGKAHLAREGSDVTLIASGAAMVPEALDAAEKLQERGISARVVDMFTIKPLDTAAVVAAARETRAVVSIENHNIYGGLGSAVAEALAENQCSVPFRRIGFPDTVGETGTLDYMKQHFGLDSESIVRTALELLQKEGA